jgi:dihydroorotate dehydrogenase electron transfer subunit
MVSRVLENENIARNVMRLTLTGDTSACAPGRFAHLAVPGFYLRRPLSLCDWDVDSYTLVYKVVGESTAAMAGWKPGFETDAMVGLGNGYDLAAFGDRPLLVGGGSGVPPLYALLKALVALGKRPVAALGFNAPDEVFMKRDFEALCQTRLAVGGYVTDALTGLDCDYVAACGPEPMLRAVCRAVDLPGQFSFEARMACGVGACMGCTCVTNFGLKRICADGPVFRREEILWTHGSI